jgi:hypothetical protein
MYLAAYSSKIVGASVVFILVGINSFSQKSNDTIFVHKYPVKEGYIRPYKVEPGRIICPSGIKCIYSKESDVFAMMEGEVRRIFKVDSIDDVEYVIIMNKRTCIVYGNLGAVFIKKGDIVRKGELIGKIKENVPNKGYELDFTTLIGNKTLLYKDYIKFFRKYNK